MQLTEKAQRAALELYGPLGEGYGKLVEGYSTDQLALILQFMRRGREQREQLLIDIGKPISPPGG